MIFTFKKISKSKKVKDYFSLHIKSEYDNF